MTPLRQRVIEDMQIRNLSHNTQAAYLHYISQFVRYFGKSPDVLGLEHIRAFQVYITQKKKLAPATITVAVSALRFLYKVSLRRDWNFDEIIPPPKKPQKLPIILSPEEVVDFLNRIPEGRYRTILTCCYAAGLRVSEAIALQVSHIDSGRMVILVTAGKGRKDRYVMLSPKLLEILRQWWRLERPKAWLFPGNGPSLLPNQCSRTSTDVSRFRIRPASASRWASRAVSWVGCSYGAARLCQGVCGFPPLRLLFRSHSYT